MATLYRAPRSNVDPEEKFSINEFDAIGLASSACVKRLRAGETLHMEGETAPFCYQVMSGFIKEYNTLEDGRRQITDFYGVGEIFGISECPEHLYTAEAITDAAVRCYPRDALYRACSSPSLSRFFMEMLISRLNQSRERMIMLGRMSASQRVAVFLFRLAEHGLPNDNIELPMSRQDIADHLGLTTETVCRSLTELKQKGLIVMPSARRFSVRDEAGLKEVARGSSK